MMEGAEQSMSDGFPKLSWMDAESAAMSQMKLDLITNKIGYPDIWPDFGTFYDGLVQEEYFEMMIELSRRSFNQSLSVLHLPVDKDKWSMAPSEVNAQYNPLFNDITMPIGIMNFPFYHTDVLRAMNFGGLIVVFAHEGGHAFDDGGSRFDGYGYLRDIWTPYTRRAFRANTVCLEEQFSGYSAGPGLSVIGSLVVGEVLADLGGVENAFTAYQRWKAENENVEDELAQQYFNMSSDELFFVAFAQIWCSKTNPEYLKLLTSTDPHPPGEFRVQGTLADSPHFRKTFNCSNDIVPCTVWRK